MKDESHVIDQARGTLKQIKFDFQEFVYSNNVIVSAAGFAVGVATKEVIENMMNIIVIPFLKSIRSIGFFKGIIKQIHSVPYMSSIFNIIGKTIYTIFIWFAIIMFTFLILEYFLNRRIVGIKTTLKENEKDDFAKAKASNNQVGKGIKNLEEKEVLVELKGNSLLKKDDEDLKKQVTTAIPQMRIQENMESSAFLMSSYPF